MTLQWWDEDRGYEFYPVKRTLYSISALSYYHRKDGKVVALWKRSTCALSNDEGTTFSEPVRVPTLVMAGGKVWGQQTDDGRYALAYNPIGKPNKHRYPLIVISGEDGIVFDNMLLVQGEVPPRRFHGGEKVFGPCYMRGIAEGNGNPPGNDMWLTYSMNKEDIWVGRVPLPIRFRVEGPVEDDFDSMDTDGNVIDWNIHDPIWAPVGVSDFPSADNKSLRLEDRDPYDYARAVRVFQEGERAKISLKVLAEQTDTGTLEIDVVDRYGNRPIRIRFNEEGRVTAMDGGTLVDLQDYEPDTWYDLDIAVNATPYGDYSLSIDDKPLLEKASLTEAVLSVERLSLRTGPHLDRPTQTTDSEKPGPPLRNADDPAPVAAYHVDKVRVSTD